CEQLYHTEIVGIMCSGVASAGNVLAPADEPRIVEVVDDTHDEQPAGEKDQENTDQPTHGDASTVAAEARDGTNPDRDSVASERQHSHVDKPNAGHDGPLPATTQCLSILK